MGAMQNNGDPTEKKKGSRGSVRNADRLEAFARGGKKGGADWGGCNPDLMQAVVVGITGLGGAVTFGLSRDQGAHSLTLLLDGNRQSMWYNGDAELDTELEGVVTTLKYIT